MLAPHFFLRPKSRTLLINSFGLAGYALPSIGRREVGTCALAGSYLVGLGNAGGWGMLGVGE